MTEREMPIERPLAGAGRRRPLLAALLVAAAAVPPAAGWQLDQTAPVGDLDAFHRHFATAVYAYPRHGAKPLGLAGFDLFADLTYGPDFDAAPFAATTLAGGLPAGALSVARVGLRKGLPGRFNLGLSYGRVLEGGIDLASADLGWSLLEGGAVRPAIALRGTYTQTLGAPDYELRQIGVEAMISKGFALLSVHGGAGLVYSDSSFAAAPGGGFDTDDTRAVLFAGLTLNVLIPKITLAVEQGEDLQWALRVALGL